MTIRLHYFALLLAPLSACGGQALDVGSNSGGSGGSHASASGSTSSGDTATGGAEDQPDEPEPSGVGAQGNEGDAGASNAGICNDEPPAGPALPAWPEPESCQEGSSALQGTWTGYVQGNDAGSYPHNGNFSITIKGDDSSLCGTITFGPPSELAPATDPATAYPPGYDLSKWLPLIDGFTYLLAEPTVSGKRVQFGIPIAQPMRSWCQLQTPYFDAENRRSWGCNRNLSTTYTYEPKQCHQTDPCTGEELLVSCDQNEICWNLNEPCACNETGCDGNSESQAQLFDLRFEGDEATGELNGNIVYLSRE